MILKRLSPADFRAETCRQLIDHRCDEHWTVEDSAGKAGARCSLWWNEVPALPDEKLGVIGHFSAESGEAGVFLLNQAAEYLAGQGCTIAVGPMDGNTWRKYRL